MTRIIISIVSTILALALSPSAHAQQSADPVAEARKACEARPYHKWLPPHAAGEINPKTQKAYKKDSKGSCRLDTKAVSAAIEAGQIKR